MIMAASEALAASNRPEDLAEGRVYPGLSDVRGISVSVACAVMKQPHAAGVATEEKSIAAIETDRRAFGDDHDGRRRDEDSLSPLGRYVTNKMYFP
ncbi:unnamed protein product, partial [Ectocarpus sp. 12 AP-2014]